jgi:hypothetical protein
MSLTINFPPCVQAGTKDGWFSDPTIEQSIKAATDGWLPGDSKYHTPGFVFKILDSN